MTVVFAWLRRTLFVFHVGWIQLHGALDNCGVAALLRFYVVVAFVAVLRSFCLGFRLLNESRELAQHVERHTYLPFVIACCNHHLLVR